MSVGFRAMVQANEEMQLSYEDFSSLLRRLVVDDELARYLSFAQQPDGLCCKIHPAEEPLQIFIEEDNRVFVMGRTAGAGPGYHAFLVGIVDQIGTELELDWTWEDDTSFAQSYDFDKVQESMTEWLAYVAKCMLKNAAADDHFSVSLPLGFQVLGEHFCASPLGFIEKSWFEDFLQNEDSRQQKAAQFFPWWTEERDSEFYFRLGLNLLWTEVPWHFPVNPEDARIPSLALDCFKRAKELDETLTPPQKELKEIKRLLATTSQIELPPSREGIGYRRHVLREKLAGDWFIDVPGFFHFETENDGATEIFWHGSRTIRVTSLTVKGKNGQVLSPREVLQQLKIPDDLGEEELLRQGDNLIGRANVEIHEDDGDEYWSLTCQAAAPGSYCLLTICYDEEEDKKWAFETWQSLDFESSS